MAQQNEEMWNYSQSIAEEEDREPETPNFKKLDTEKVEKAANKINKILKNNSKDSKKKAKARYIKNNFPANLRKYEQKEKVLKNRSSYSKTDEVANFMQKKDDHMQNG